MTNFRVYKRDLIFRLGVDDENLFSGVERFMGCPLSIEPILSFLATYSKSHIGEIPSDEPKRLLGEEKVKKWRWGIAYFLQILITRFKLMRGTHLIRKASPRLNEMAFQISTAKNSEIKSDEPLSVTESKLRLNEDAQPPMP